jgi:hypothetical protein
MMRLAGSDIPQLCKYGGFVTTRDRSPDRCVWVFSECSDMIAGLGCVQVCNRKDGHEAHDNSKQRLVREAPLESPRRPIARGAVPREKHKERWEC